MPTVRLDGMLRTFVPRLHLESSADTVEGLLDDLEERFPRLRSRIRNEVRAIRPFVRIFVNGTALDRATAPGHALRTDDKVDILHSIQGG